MIVQHRLIGNIPGRGHGAPLLSTAFPLDSGLATTATYRAPDPGQITDKAARTSEDGRYHLFLSTFELQATHFGRFALVSANVFRPVDVVQRPRIYMDTVVMTDDQGTPLYYLPPERLLTFSNFIQPAQFDTFSPTTIGLEATAWQPASVPARRPFFAPKTAAHRSLLARYWAAASSRMFGGSAPTVSILLGNQVQPPVIIENAKALLLRDILDYLPPAVRNIASMSAGASLRAVQGVFSDSALAVIYPTAPDDPQPDFNLCRRDGYPALSPLEDQFMCALLENGHGQLMRDVLSRYMQCAGWADESLVSFAADYDFALLLYQLECFIDGKAYAPPAASCLALWKQINNCLLVRHHLSPGQTDEVLAGVEARLLPVLLSSGEAIASLDEAMMPFVWEKALTVEETLFPQFASLIVSSPAVDCFPLMIGRFPELSAGQADRTASLISRIGAAHYTQRALTPELVLRMTAAPFSAILTAHPQVSDALRGLLLRTNEAFPDNLLTTLPLSCMLLDGRQALADALQLLLRTYTAHLPTAQQIDDLAAACSSFADAALRAVLCDYFAACLPEQCRCLEPLAAMIRALMPDAGAALLSLLASAEQHGILLDAAQLHALLGTLTPHCADPAAIGRAYAAYETRLSAQTGELPQSRLERLAACAGDLHAVAFDATTPVQEMLHMFISEHRLLTPEQSDAFVGKLWPLCRDSERIASAFHEYLLGITRDDPGFYFTHTEALRSLTPFIDATRTDMTDTVCGILDSIALTMPCAPIAQLRPFLEQLLPQCGDQASVRQMLMNYVEKSIEDRTDCFPWLEQIHALCTKYALLDEHKPLELPCRIAEYLCDQCIAEGQTPSHAAFSWLLDFAHSCTDTFRALPILDTYERLLGMSCAREAAGQLRQLLPYFPRTTGHPAVCRLDQQATCEAFCSLLRSCTLLDACNRIYFDMQRCGLSEEELINRTRNEVTAALRREFSALQSPEAFEKAHIKLANSARERRHNEVLAEEFSTFAAKQNNCPLEQIEKLNAVARRLGVKANSLPDTIRHMAQIITQPGAGAEQFRIVLNDLGELRNSGQSMPHIIQELSGMIARDMETLVYPQVVYAAILCHMNDNGRTVGWNKVFSALGMNLSGKLPDPLTAQGLAWVSAIHAVCRALDMLARQPGCDFRTHFLNYLNRSDFAEFSESIAANGKRRNRILPPECIESELMRKWLGI